MNTLQKVLVDHKTRVLSEQSQGATTTGIERVEINTRHPNLCHVQCIMKPSMKVGKYRIYKKGYL